MTTNNEDLCREFNSALKECGFTGYTEPLYDLWLSGRNNGWQERKSFDVKLCKQKGEEFEGTHDRIMCYGLAKLIEETR